MKPTKMTVMVHGMVLHGAIVGDTAVEQMFMFFDQQGAGPGRISTLTEARYARTH